MSLAIGLDVSELRMGWAVVDYDDQRPLAWGVENLRERDGGWPEDQVLRAVHGIVDCGAAGEVVVVGIEDAYKGPSIKGSMRHAGMVGMATMAARVTFGSKATYWPIPAGTWREPLDLRPASRKRADLKEAAIRWARERTGQDVEEDAAEALGIATACALLTVPTDA